MLLSKEAAFAKISLMNIIKDVPFSATADSWTACDNTSYITCTVHFIDPKTWLLHHFCIGLVKKTGRSTAEDVIEELESMWETYSLNYYDVVCLVTDTDATMCKVGRLFVSSSEDQGGCGHWHGCFDHLLELITGVAFEDNADTVGTMKAARALVGYFSSSSQATEYLLSIQVGIQAVRLIQDVVTRWWSTFSMCMRLLRLKPYLALMEANGLLDCNLTEAQWQVIADTCTILQPFMIAQKFLEGESYVTISMFSYLCFTIKKGTVVDCFAACLLLLLLFNLNHYFSFLFFSYKVLLQCWIRQQQVEKRQTWFDASY
jgi:hypothetical protein